MCAFIVLGLVFSMCAFIVLGLVFSYQAKKWSILCMGRKTPTYSINSFPDPFRVGGWVGSHGLVIYRGDMPTADSDLSQYWPCLMLNNFIGAPNDTATMPHWHLCEHLLFGDCQTPFVQVSMAWALTCPETVHRRPCITREMEIRFSIGW